ncbi:M23 family metallopeptidase [Sphingomonas sp. Leaf4]|uniref:M23 family metallopeptidase n=1 Tax=Sphingomonas sp. Leaf4 TaxID=2876553 RepID=UPI001E5B5709|nr:M23 family metallopeptidase [Sphingomonas sp. Leaf4]
MNRIGWAFLGFFGVAILLAAFLIDTDDERPPAFAAPAVVAPAAPLPAGVLTVPVEGAPWRAIRDSWGEARGDGTRGHTGTDIMAPSGTPVLAAADGVVEKRFFSPGGGGITLYLRSPDRRLSYYYAHLAGYAAGIAEGARIRAGQVIGYVGDSGNAGRGNTHLHFGIERIDPAQPWYRGQAIDPYPLLARGRRSE